MIDYGNDYATDTADYCDRHTVARTLCGCPWSQSPQQSPHVSETAETAETAETVPQVTGPRLWKATDLKPAEPTRWLVRGHLPLAQTVVLIGDEGIGKSLWWVLVVASITSGYGNQVLGIADMSPRDVLLVLTEDSWTTDVRPRLEVAGADLDRIHVIAEDDDGSGSIEFPRDLPLVTRATEGLDLALVVVDAWLDTVEGSKQVKDPQQARQALHPWRHAAQTTGAAVLLLAHSNRTDAGTLRDRVGATAALRQKARVLLYAARPPDAESVMYLGPNKANGSAISKAIAYRIETVQLREPTPDDPGTIARLVAESRTLATMEDHYGQWRADQRRSENPSADDRALAWLLDYLGKHNGEAPAVDAKASAHAAGHNPDRLARLVRAQGGFAGPNGEGGPWVYRVPMFSQVQSSQSSQSPQSQKHGETATETHRRAP